MHHPAARHFHLLKCAINYRAGGVSSKGTGSSAIRKCCLCRFIFPGENASWPSKKPFVAAAPGFVVKSDGTEFLWKMCCLNVEPEPDSARGW